MMERETIQFNTPQEHSVVAYTYLTGGEARALRAVYLKDEASRSARIEEVENLTLKTLIVSFDGKADGQDGFDLIGTLMVLPASETKFLVDKLNELTKDGDEKKTS
jgi:hypothetical protein